MQANGIQAVDLLGRKILYSSDPALDIIERRIDATVNRARKHNRFADHAETLACAWTCVQDTVAKLRHVDPVRVLDDATRFMRAFGHVVISWLWLDQCVVDSLDQDRMRGKITACDYMFHYELPQAELWLALVAKGFIALGNQEEMDFI